MIIVFPIVRFAKFSTANRKESSWIRTKQYIVYDFQYTHFVNVSTCYSPMYGRRFSYGGYRSHATRVTR